MQIALKPPFWLLSLPLFLYCCQWPKDEDQEDGEGNFFPASDDLNNLHNIPRLIHTNLDYNHHPFQFDVPLELIVSWAGAKICEISFAAATVYMYDLIVTASDKAKNGVQRILSNFYLTAERARLGVQLNWYCYWFC